MTLSKAEVEAIASYARMALSPQELDEAHVYLNDMIETLKPITQYDLEGVEPTYHPIGGLANVMREDKAGSSLELDEALCNAGQTEGRFFKVPSILSSAE